MDVEMTEEQYGWGDGGELGYKISEIRENYRQFLGGR